MVKLPKEKVRKRGQEGRRWKSDRLTQDRSREERGDDGSLGSDGKGEGRRKGRE